MVQSAALSEYPGDVVQPLARLEQAFTCEAHRWERVAGHVLHGSIKNVVCRYPQAPGTQLGDVGLPHFFPALASGASPCCGHYLLAFARLAPRLLPHLTEVEDSDSSIVEALPLLIGAGTGARGIPDLHRDVHPVVDDRYRAGRVAFASAQPGAELGAETPRVEPAADPEDVRAVPMPGTEAGRCAEHLVKLGPAIRHRADLRPVSSSRQ